MPDRISPRDLKAALHDGSEIALLDIREHGQYGEGHLFLATPLPYSRLEAEAERLVPRRGTRIVLYDNGTDSVAGAAVCRLRDLGYEDVRVLTGGAPAWAAAGFRLLAGVNVVSKAFGELVEHAYGVPSIAAEELHRRLSDGERIIVIDGRPVEEYRAMNIPGALCCPNGELAVRIGAIAPDPFTPIVINCAGRTRSIMGAEILRSLGLPNPVLALRNGTMGWRLAGLALEHGSNRLYPEKPADLAARRTAVAALARRWGVISAAPETVLDWAADPSRTLYVLDVRTREEFESAHLPGAVHAPGGQLLQATDQWLAVRNARVVLVDDDELRATVIAGWLRQMGWDAHPLRGGKQSWPVLAGHIPAAGRAEAILPTLDIIEPRALTAGGMAGTALLDIRPSMRFRAGHLRGARWTNRARLGTDLAALSPKASILLVSEEPILARIIARDLREAGRKVAGMLAGGTEAWCAAGLAVETTPDDPPDEDCIDRLFFLHDRHAGNLEAARRYIAWETGLVDELDAQERQIFHLRVEGAHR